MPYTNIGQLIEPYLRPLGKQTIAQIPQIQAHQLAKERLGGQKQIWDEEIAESKQSREIARQAQERLNQLSGISPEQLQPFIGEGQDADTAMKLMLADKANLSSLGPDKAPAAEWKEIETRDAQGNLVKQFVDVSKQAPRQQYQIPTQKVKIGNKTFDVPIEAATALEAYRMKEIADNDKWERDRDEKRRKDEIKYLEDRMEDAKAIGPAAQEMYTIYTKKLSGLIGQPTAGVARDPEVDKARAMIMEAVQDIKMYEKASQDQEDKGAPLAPTSTPQVPQRQFVMPPTKEDKPKPVTPTEIRMRMKTAADAEEKILNPEMEGNPALASIIPLFNLYSDKPYVYVWKEEHIKTTKRKVFWDKKETIPGKAVKVEFPVINGKTVTRADIFKTMEQEGMTFVEVLKLIGVME